MKVLKATVVYKVPGGLYCNHTMQKSTITTRCRFCTETSRGNYTCVLHNDVLSTNGALINKAYACLARSRDIVDTPSIPPQELIKHTVLEYQRIYSDLRKQGYPEAIAAVNARDMILKGECK